ncbi:unnamed protein product [Amoebophrya sp. A120]|nr:unnamed protein product [Amoebophrya sp. A120]|eukprot:GSA120T00019525001.1
MKKHLPVRKENDQDNNSSSTTNRSRAGASTTTRKSTSCNYGSSSSIMQPAGGRRERKRLEKELADMREKNKAGGGVVADAIGENIQIWEGVIQGPEDTPYFGGVYKIQIEIPDDYPYNPPKMKFVTKIWHPNISSQTGAICLDVLGKEWSPALSIRTALLSIQALLSAAEPDDPQDAEVAKMYKSNRTQFNETAKYWCETYAQENANAKESSYANPHQPKIDQIMEIRSEQKYRTTTYVKKFLRPKNAMIGARPV